MADLLLHIGGPKTGSTYIQHVLYNNRCNLESHQVGPVFPGKNHFQLALVGAESDERKRFYKWGRTSADTMEQFQELTRNQIMDSAKRYELAYVSSEFLLHSVSTLDGVDRVLALLGEVFDRIHVAVFVRRPEFLIVPTYSTAVRAGRSHAIESQEFLGINTQSQSRRVEKWQKRLDRINLNVIPYLERDSGYCLMERLLSCAGIPDLVTELQIPSIRINQSLSGVGIESLRIFNRTFINLPESTRLKVVQFIESETSKFRKSSLTEKQFEDAKRFSTSETLKLQKMIQPMYQSKFKNQDPVYFAQVSQDLIPLIYENEISEVISKASIICSQSKKE